MSGFSIPSITDEEIAGPSSELVGKLLLIHRENVVNVNTVYGEAPAMRVHAFEVTKKGVVALGLRLLYWSGVQRQIASAEEPWLAGTIVVQPQSNDPERTFYSIQAPSEDQMPLVKTAYDELTTAEPF